MTPGQWAQLKEIFSAATEKPRSERGAFLDQACPDAGLRREVEKLLEAEGRPKLESPLRTMLAPLARPAMIGRYRIIRLIGEGGMGAVYEAEQDQPRRRVAVKAIKAGLASPELLRRFEHEAQALGRLHHPGIAQIYEAGAADTGFGPQPYFAMEFIEGVPLSRYAQEHGLGVREQLELMAKVCEAVHHAHQRGIIHRDLKPGNILVGETGEPKIVDFGVARATDADALATRHTDFGQLLGTLAYMSPEQVLADPLELDTRSDVYALGVILYELLAGRLPYQIGENLPTAVQAIRDQDPARLSSIESTFRGDIETIVSKALEKDKARRYSSAAELAADIRRYLRDEPIVARRSTATYQLRKFGRRHRALVAAVGAALVMLIAGVIVSTWEAAQARLAGQEALRQRDRAAAAQRTATGERNLALAEKQHADTETAAAKAISDFLENDLLAQASASVQARPNNKPDPDLKVRTALDRAAARIAGRFDRQPLVEAAIRQIVGQTYKDLGLFPEAQRQLERALELRQRTAGDAHRDTLDTMFGLAILCREQGKYGEAERLLTRVIEGRGRIFGEGASETAAAQRELALLFQEQSKYAQAEKILANAVEIERRILGEQHPETLASMGALANLYRLEGKYAAAAPLLIQVVNLNRRVLGEDHPQTQTSMDNLARLHFTQEDYTKAESQIRVVLANRRRVLGEEHPLTIESMHMLAEVTQAEHKYAESEALSVKVLEIRQRTLGKEHPDTLDSMNSLANLFFVEGKYAAAEPLMAQVLEAGRRVYGEEHRTTLEAAYNLASAYRFQDKLALAEPLLLKTLAVYRRVYGEEHPSTLQIVYELGVVYRMERKYAEAEVFGSKAMEGFRRAMGEEHSDTLNSMIGLAVVYQEEGKLAEAEPLFLKALDVSRRVLGAEDPDTVTCLTWLGKLRLAQHRYAEAEPLLREASNAPGDKWPYRSWMPFRLRTLLGLSLLGQSKYAEAEPLLVSGYRGLGEHRSELPATVSLRETAGQIVRLYTDWGKPDQAAEWRKEIEAAEPVTFSAKDR